MNRTVGLVDAHSHLRSTSLFEHEVPGSCLEEAILRMNAMTGVDPFDDAFVAASDLISVGITGVQVIFHTFGTPDQYLELLGKTISGIRAAGIRARVILAITDQYEFLPQRHSSFALPKFVDVGPRMTPRQFIELFDEAIAQYPDIDFGIGPVAPQWCSDEMMAALGEKASSSLRVHTHCLESELQRDWIDESPILRLDRFGLLANQTSLAHAIWLTETELDLVKERGAQLVTCPRSNQVLKSGQAPISTWVKRDIEFGIGLDSLAGKESPLEVALLSMDNVLASYALTTGGANSVGLETARDEVTWSDWSSGKIESVYLAGKLLVANGVLVTKSEVELARSRISATMEEDKSARLTRHSELNALMPTYLAALK